MKIYQKSSVNSFTGVSNDECAVFGGNGFKPPGNYRHPDNSNWFYTCYGDNRQPECQQCGADDLHFIKKCEMCMYEQDGKTSSFEFCKQASYFDSVNSEFRVVVEYYFIPRSYVTNVNSSLFWTYSRPHPHYFLSRLFKNVS